MVPVVTSVQDGHMKEDGSNNTCLEVEVEVARRVLLWYCSMVETVDVRAPKCVALDAHSLALVC